MPRLTLKMNIFPSISLERPEMWVGTIRTELGFSEMIDLRGHMPRFTPKMNVFPSISLEACHKCVLKPSAQGSFL